MTVIPARAPYQAALASRWTSVSASGGSLYLKALAYTLVGYAVIGKGFAYLGVPPLYLGEVLLITGLFFLIQSRCALSTLSVPANLLLLVLGAWTAFRTLPYLGVYGIDAIRDSVIVLYGLFGLVVCGLIVERPERVLLTFRFYWRFAWLYGPGAWLVRALSIASTEYGLLPNWPNSGWPLFAARPGEIAVHLAGSAVFAILFFRRIGTLWLASMIVGIGLVSAQSRGGMLSILFPLALATVFAGRWRAMTRIILLTIALVMGGLLFEGIQPGGADKRQLNVGQVITNIGSVVGGAEDDALAGTKAWRLMWWTKIIDYTVHGPYFWTGKGFGIPLAEADGFGGTTDADVPVLRSPHNANFTLLARAGVPGFILWVLLIITWLAMMLWNALLARRRGETDWSNLFLFIACYFLAALIDASFDVALEGPMLGIWFWSLFGFGSGLTMIYAAHRASGLHRSLALARI